MLVGLVAWILLACLAGTARASLDPQFGSDGSAEVDFSGSGGRATSVAIQPDGKVIVAGSSAGDFAVARLTAQGDPDPAFSGDGFATLDQGGTENAAGVDLLPDGRVVLAGVSTAGDGTGQVVAIRLLPNGELDPSFGGDGIDFPGFSRRPLDVTDAVLEPSGTLLVSATPGYQLVRIGPNGGLDPSLDSDGHLKQRFRAGRYRGGFGIDLALDPQGRIVYAGDAYRCVRSGPDPCRSEKSNFAAMRLTPSGRLDRSFSDDGQAAVGRRQNDYAGAVAVAGDGSMLVAGGSGRFSRSDETDLSFARLTPDGRPDRGFGEGGTFVFGETGFANAAAPAPSGFVVAGRFGSDSGPSAFAVLRTNGSNQRGDEG